jgi:hypothetical protein
LSPRNSQSESGCMRYLVRVRVKAGREQSLLRGIKTGTLGAGSVAEGELQEERPYWEQYFELTRIQDAHDRPECRDARPLGPYRLTRPSFTRGDAMNTVLHSCFTNRHGCRNADRADRRTERRYTGTRRWCPRVSADGLRCRQFLPVPSLRCWTLYLITGL